MKSLQIQSFSLVEFFENLGSAITNRDQRINETEATFIEKDSDDSCVAENSTKLLKIHLIDLQDVLQRYCNVPFVFGCRDAVVISI